nr:hypothetical protein [Bacillota bacterium]
MTAMKPREEETLAEAPRLILDIGTHKVLGLAAVPAGSGVRVLASALARHPDRSMRDGQVHDVKAVAKAIRQVVRELEQATGQAFHEAHVAAAGRALRTAKGRAETSHAHPVTLSEEAERGLVWEAVASAQAHLLEELPPAEQARGYYAVAHSVTASWLDGDPIRSLLGQRGQQFAVEVLATFLPGVVVDSLEAALREAGLEVKGLTLEPIAALEAVIPPTSRHLHLALIDIGAGTSDIALTGGGTVKAYAMVPRAGDAITEAVSQALLLDFSVAEQVKRRVARGETVAVENVLGEQVVVDPPLLSDLIGEATVHLAEAIAEEVVRWAAGGLDAVLLVGGGSQTPGLAAHLARCLDMPEQRVAVRDRRAVRNVEGAGDLSGPDAVTALGIALRACRGEELPPVRVRVNGRPVCLFLPDRCTVREAARVAGLSPSDLMGRLGPGITVTVNGEVLVVPGTRGEPAVAWLRGQRVCLDTVLKNQDEVVLDPPKPGLPARPTVAEVVDLYLRRRGGRLEQPPPRVRALGQWREVPLWVGRRGRRVRMDELVYDRDVLEVRWPRNGRELLEVLQDPGEQDVSGPVAEEDLGAGAAGAPRQAAGAPAFEAGPAGGVCWVNGEPVQLARFFKVYRNGAPAELSEPVEDGDTWEWESLGPVTVGVLLDEMGIERESVVHVTVNGRPVSVRQPANILLNGVPADPSDRVSGGDVVEVRPARGVSLYEILPHAGVSWDARHGDRRRLVLKVKGNEADFTTEVFDGDDVTIGFA